MMIAGAPRRVDRSQCRQRIAFRGRLPQLAQSTARAVADLAHPSVGRVGMTAWASSTTEAPDSGRMAVRHSAACASVEDHEGQPLATDFVSLPEVNRQNSLSSGSARTTQSTSSWPMSMRVAPREVSRATSAC